MKREDIKEQENILLWELKQIDHHSQIMKLATKIISGLEAKKEWAQLYFNINPEGNMDVLNKVLDSNLEVDMLIYVFQKEYSKSEQWLKAHNAIGFLDKCSENTNYPGPEKQKWTIKLKYKVTDIFNKIFKTKKHEKK